MTILDKFLLKLDRKLDGQKGGKGSGNFGHKGRPGKRGGSLRRGLVSGGDNNAWTSGKRYDTSQLPLHMSATYRELDDQDTRNYMLEAAKRGKNLVDPMIDDKQFSEMEKLFREPIQVPKDMEVYFGLKGDTFKNLKPGDEFRSYGFRSTSLTKERADTYASKEGTIFQVSLPKGTKAVPARVMDIDEVGLMPGTKFKVVSSKDGVTKLKIVEDGQDYLREILQFRDKVRKTVKENS